MVYNNLCPICEAKRVAGEDISAFTERLKINPFSGSSDTILVCIHEGNCSITDIGTCGCGKRGFIVPPEYQVGIYKDRDVIEQLVVDVQSQDRGIFCSSCNQIANCERCGCSSRSRITLHLVDVDLSICKSCARHYKLCMHCGEYHTLYNSDLEAWLCEKCAPLYTRCNACSSLIKREDSIEWTHNSKGCVRCIAVGMCEWCGKSTHIKSTNGNYLCKEHTEMFHNVAMIEGYHHTKVKEYIKLPNEGKTNCFLGIEWEAQVNITGKKFPVRTVGLRRRLLANEVKKLFPEVETKRDGSLSMMYGRGSYENGVESVWQPMTYEFISKNRDKFKDLFKKVKPMLHKDMPQSGMHIHISKKAFTPFHFLKFTNFFYTQEKMGFLFYIAKRTSTNYSQVKLSYSFDGKKYGVKQTGSRTALHYQAQLGKAIKLARTRNFNPDRYDVLNITNQHTFEIRAFKSPTKYEDFMANIEYVYAMFLYTKDVSNNDMSLVDFFNFVEKNNKKFPELFIKTTTYRIKENI